MSVARFRELFWLDLTHYLRRPLFWIWVVVVVLTAWGTANGGVQVDSGDADVGGTKPWMTSEFHIAFIFSIFVLFVHTFFIAVAAGIPLIRDDELRIGELIHSSPVRPGEYIWAKYLAPLVASLVVLTVHLVATMVSNHQLAGADLEELVGPFALRNYLRPVLIFAVPTVLFVSGVTFAVGAWTRRPIVVFVLPVVLFLACIFFLWDFNPPWLGESGKALLQLADPTGFRWLNETWLAEDQGVDFYNSASIPLSGLLLVNRIGFGLLGILAVVWSHRQFAKNIRGRSGPATAISKEPAPRELTGTPVLQRLADLCMLSRPVGFVRAFLCVLRVELRELRSQPGLYLFVPIIVLFSVLSGLERYGAFETRVLATPGLLARGIMPWLTVLLGFLLMFYTIESLRRERATMLGPIFYSTPMGSAAMYFGKIAANALIGFVAVGIAFLACWVIVGIEGVVPFDYFPFAIVWGLLLIPTFVFWCSFVAFVYTLTRNAWASYGIGFATLIYTGWKLGTGGLTWEWNWPLWSIMGWSDADVFPLDREALVLNRLMVLGAALFFVIVSVRIFPRREFDPQRILLRLRPLALLRTGLLLSPIALIPITLNVWLGYRVDAGYQGEYRDKEQKDYWRKNVATWLDAPVPDIANADVKLELAPERRWFRTEGEFELVNRTGEDLRSFPVTSGPHWEDLSWTVDGEPYEPEDRMFLHVFTPATPLPPDGRVTVGFSHAGIVNEGISRGGGGAGQFILPAGVVLHSFGPTFVPSIGFMEGVGVDEDNSYDAREYPVDHYEGDTPSGFGGWAPYPVRIEVSAPAEYIINGIGVQTSDEVSDGIRTVVWETDHPVQFFNVIAGKWDVRRGEGTAVYYFPAHPFNVDEMIEALDGAREHYSRWFYPYPWEELKLSEFANLAGYAQGFATNITFSEGIGFLTESNEESNAAFFVTAHESAHQWWGNILSPGRGPGGNLLSEGTSHFSTMLLFEEVKGEQARIAFCRQIERQYARSRVADSERALVWIDGSRPGDTTVTYDKAGWVFWMLLHHMGRERCLDGIRSFIAHYVESRDHPVLQDFTAHLRDFAPDVEAYDAFVRQWFHEVVLPKYELADVEVREVEEGVRWEVSGIVRNTGTGRMPIQLAAERGTRFPDEDEDEDAVTAEDGPEPEESADEPFADSRVTVVLASDDEATFRIECDFEPERVVVDPDALVLQLGRAGAREDDL